MEQLPWVFCVFRVARIFGREWVGKATLKFCWASQCNATKSRACVCSENVVYISAVKCVVPRGNDNFRMWPAPKSFVATIMCFFFFWSFGIVACVAGRPEIVKCQIVTTNWFGENFVLFWETYKQILSRTVDRCWVRVHNVKFCYKYSLYVTI